MSGDPSQQQSHFLVLALFPIFPAHNPPFPHLFHPLPPLTFASVLSSSRSSESETSVRRKVSLVLEQLQPLVVSGLLMVE